MERIAKPKRSSKKKWNYKIVFRDPLRNQKTAQLPLCILVMNANLFLGRNFNRLAVCAALACSLMVGGCAGNRYERSTGESIDDTATTMRVKNALGKDPIYKFPDVTVTTFKGTVQLGGFVDNDDQKIRAEDITKGVEGVKQITNVIEIKR